MNMLDDTFMRDFFGMRRKNDASVLSLRDYFAARAMQGMVMAVGLDGHEAEVDPTGVAKDSYAMADAMLKARS